MHFPPVNTITRQALLLGFDVAKPCLASITWTPCCCAPMCAPMKLKCIVQSWTFQKVLMQLVCHHHNRKQSGEVIHSEASFMVTDSGELNLLMCGYFTFFNNVIYMLIVVHVKCWANICNLVWLVSTTEWKITHGSSFKWNSFKTVFINKAQSVRLCSHPESYILFNHWRTCSLPRTQTSGRPTLTFL